MREIVRKLIRKIIEVKKMDLIFKVAAVGMLVAILNVLLEQTGRKEIALMTTILGLVVVLSMVATEISGLFANIKRLFGF